MVVLVVAWSAAASHFPLDTRGGEAASLPLDGFLPAPAPDNEFFFLFPVPANSAVVPSLHWELSGLPENADENPTTPPLLIDALSYPALVAREEAPGVM